MATSFQSLFYQGGHQMLAEPEIEVGRRCGGGGGDRIRTMTYCQLTYVRFTYWYVHVIIFWYKGIYT